MNDRFKFRTYLPDLKIFKYWGWIEDSHYIDLCACGDYQKPELLEKYTNQCTGLKDKNGKLIFEGDILKENWHIYKLEWENGAYTIKDIKRGTSYMFTSGMCIEKSEVIGNIYQDSHLLANNGKNTDLAIDKDVFDIEFELISECEVENAR